MFKRVVYNVIKCDSCGKTNEDVKCAIESFSAFERLSIIGMWKTSDRDIEYRKYTSPHIYHVCPCCAKSIYKFMTLDKNN